MVSSFKKKLTFLLHLDNIFLPLKQVQLIHGSWKQYSDGKCVNLKGVPGEKMSMPGGNLLVKFQGMESSSGI